MSEETYGRGQTVYANGSHGPTKGTVDPTGYVDRALNNNSDSRSGLAQAAMARLKGAGVPQNPNPGVSPLGDIKTLTITPTGQLIPDQGLDSMSPALNGTPAPANLLMQAALSRILANGGTPNANG